MKTLFAIALVALLAGCSRPDKATMALEAAGYTSIKIKGWSPFGCSDSDQFTTKFEAVGPTGIHVEGVVCGGIFKGSTIRTN